MEDLSDVESPEKKKTKQQETAESLERLNNRYKGLSDKYEDVGADLRFLQESLSRALGVPVGGRQILDDETPDSLESRIELLEKQYTAMREQVSALRDDLERVLGIPLVRYKSGSYTTVKLDFAKGYETQRSVMDVQFRTPDGAIKYPAMDKRNSDKKKSARKKADGEEVVEMVYSSFPDLRKVLSVSYYQAMEQLQKNTEVLERLNTSVLPILYQKSMAWDELVTRLTGVPLKYPSLRYVPEPVEDMRFWVVDQPRVPSLGLYAKGQPIPSAYGQKIGLAKQTDIETTKVSRALETQRAMVEAERDAERLSAIDGEDAEAKRKADEYAARKLEPSSNGPGGETTVFSLPDLFGGPGDGLPDLDFPEFFAK